MKMMVLPRGKRPTIGVKQTAVRDFLHRYYADMITRLLGGDENGWKLRVEVDGNTMWVMPEFVSETCIFVVAYQEEDAIVFSLVSRLTARGERWRLAPNILLVNTPDVELTRREVLELMLATMGSSRR
jgi:hypothetical protein